MKPKKRRNLSSRAKNIDTNNPHPRLAICLCLDTSNSMMGHPIRELNSGLRLFYKTIWANSESRYAVDLAIVTFGCNGVRCLQPFAQLYEGLNPPLLKSDGMTPMGEAVNLALNLIEERRRDYWELGIPHYHARLILMADGKPNGSVIELRESAARTKELESKNRLVVIPVGVGNNAVLQSLSAFSRRVSPMKLRGLDFTAFFKWLSVSVEEVASKHPDDDNDLELPKADWILADGGWDSVGTTLGY